MDAKKIGQIIDSFGAFLQSSEYKRIMSFFVAQIPESLLPYPKNEIEEALDVYIKHFEKIGKNDNQSQAFIASRASFSVFVDDATAIKHAYERLNR